MVKISINVNGFCFENDLEIIIYLFKFYIKCLKYLNLFFI